MVLYKCKSCGAPLCFTHFSLNKGVCKTCHAKGIILPSPIRRSHLDTFFQCPYKAYVYMMQKHTSEGNLWSNVGNMLHDIFEISSVSPNKYTEDELIKEFDKRLHEFMESNPKHVSDAQQLTKGDVVQSMYERGSTSIKNYMKYEKVTGIPMLTEHYIEFPVRAEGALPLISCTIDRINGLEDDEVEIVDYKTGHTTSGPALQSGFQVPVYILAYQHAFGKLPLRFKLLYLEDDNERVFEKVDDDIYRLTVKKNTYDISLKDSKKRINDMLQDMTDGKWSIPKTLNGFHCTNFCDVYKANICPGKDQKAWMNGKKDINA